MAPPTQPNPCGDTTTHTHHFRWQPLKDVPVRDKVFCFGSFGFWFLTVATLVVAVRIATHIPPITTQDHRKANHYGPPKTADNMYVSLFMVNWVIYVAADKLCFSALAMSSCPGIWIASSGSGSSSSPWLWHWACKWAFIFVGPVKSPHKDECHRDQDADVAGCKQFVLELR